LQVHRILDFLYVYHYIEFLSTSNLALLFTQAIA
jgi:hypothetical protein